MAHPTPASRSPTPTAHPFLALLQAAVPSARRIPFSDVYATPKADPFTHRTYDAQASA